VPIAYDVFPLSDVCKFALPVPEVTPVPVDFGAVPFGREATRMLHVVNRAPIELTASFRGNLFDVPARGSMDLTTAWRPDGDDAGCSGAEREEAIVFTPRDSAAPVSPQQQTVRVVEHARVGREIVQQRVHVDTGEHHSPDYAATARDLACPDDYVVSACRTEHAACADGGQGCTTAGYALTATQVGNACHFACQGPSAILLGSNFCRFDAVAECRLRCDD
jgi:hypothetical protein